MFESLGEKFENLWRKLQGQGRITERNIEDALRDVRLALLEADVNFDVVRDFVERSRRTPSATRCCGASRPSSTSSSWSTASCSGSWATSRSRSTSAARARWSSCWSACNGSGKTTTAAKLARHLRDEPGAAPTWSRRTSTGPPPSSSSRRSARADRVPRARGLAGDRSREPRAQRSWPPRVRTAADTVLIDTAGRLHVDDELMKELERMNAARRRPTRSSWWRTR